MRSLLTGLLVMVAAGIAVWRLVPNAPEPSSKSDRPAWTGGRLREHGGMTVLELSGSPRQKGRAHGKRLKERIIAWYERTRLREGEMESLWNSFHAPQATKRLPDAIREEMEGVAEGAGMDFNKILFLNLLYDLRGFRRGEGFGFSAPGAVRKGGDVIRRFVPADLNGQPRELVIFVHRDDRPMVLVALPGMVGGFLGTGGFRSAMLRPVQQGPDPVMTGLGWTLYLRRVLEAGPDLEDPVTLDASIPFASDSRVGTLDVSPRGRVWHASGGDVAAANPEPLSQESSLDDQRLRVQRTRAHQVLTEKTPGHQISVRVQAFAHGCKVTIVRDGVEFMQSIRYSD